MKEEIFLSIQNWFKAYVTSYYSDDTFIQKNIKLKEEHSIRVCENASLIAEAQGLHGEDLFLARTIALLHDIGRFEQIRKYRTFKDSDSEDHALLGSKILREKGIISSLDAKEQEIILTAVENHNKYRIDDKMEDRTRFHSELIRDADKLDIYRVLTDYYAVKERAPNSALYMGLPDIPEYSKELVQDLFNNKLASIKHVRTCNDMNLTRLAWLFDMNFRETIRLVRERNHIDELIDTLPDNEEIRSLHAHLNNYMDSAMELR